MSESATPDNGPLSVDAAVAMLVDPPTEQEAPEAPIEAAEGEPEPQGEPEAPEVAEDGAETPAEEEEAEAAPEPEKLDAPLYWKPEAKEAFSKLDPVLQAEILSQEGPREEAAAKAKAQAAAEVEKAQKDTAGVQALAAKLSEFLPQAIETFTQRWGEPDWAVVAEEQGADRAFILKAQYDKEQAQLAQVQQATQTAQIEARKAFLQTEWKELEQIAPELTDPAKGQERRSEVIKYLIADGIPKEATDAISAREMRIARKAMLYDQLEAKAALKPPPKPTAPAPRPTARPSAAVPQSSQRSAAANRFAQTRSVDDAVALLVAKG